MHASYMLMLHYTSIVIVLIYIYRDVFTVGIALIRVTDTSGNAIVSANAIGDYSYVNDRSVIPNQIARCITGLGPSNTEDNSDIGEVYFGGSSIPFVECSDDSSASVQPRQATNLNNLGVINVIQCRAFTTTVEGIYTCTMINSSMMEKSIRFGVYFNSRSESFNLCIPSLNHLSSTNIHSWSCDKHSISFCCNSYYWFFPHIILYFIRFSPRHIHMDEGW